MHYKRLRLSMLLLLLILVNYCSGQNQALSVGNIIPDMPIGKTLNGGYKGAKFSDFSGKLVILDFWNVHCGSCIASMPEIDSLQTKFAGSVQFIMVTYNNKSEVQSLRSRIKIKFPNVPIVIEDTQLNKLFPHEGDPLHVWINGKGKIVYITNEWNTTAENIKTFLGGDKIAIANRSRLKDFNASASFLSTSDIFLHQYIKSYSVLLNGLHSSIGVYAAQERKDSVTGKVIQLHILNATLFQLYNIAYNSSIYGYKIDPSETIINFRNFNNRICLKVKDPSRFFQALESSKIDSSYYSYEVSISSDYLEDIYSVMQKDLKKYFHYDARIIDTVMNCFQLVKSDNTPDYRVKNTAERPELRYHPNNILTIQNLPITALVKLLVINNSQDSIPFIDGTKMNYPINLSLNSKILRLKDKDELRRALRKYGFDLKENKQRIKILQISDSNKEDLE